MNQCQHFLAAIVAVLLLAPTMFAQSEEVKANPVKVVIDGKEVTANPSPDGESIVWVHRTRHKSDIMIANVDGSNVRNLTNSNTLEGGADWYPDGEKIVFSRSISNHHEIYSMNADGSEVSQLTDSDFGSRNPQFSSIGHLAWITMHERRGKLQPSDVVVTIDDTQKTIAENLNVTGMAWSPNGEVLAIASVGNMTFIHVENDERSIIALPSVDTRLNAHGPNSLQWDPTGESIGCRITFVGGRMVGTHVFGDDEYFVIKRDGEMSVFENLDAAIEELDWIRDDSR